MIPNSGVYTIVDAQKLRLRRWSMGMGTYALNILAVFAAQMLELVYMPRSAYILMVTTALAGNLCFFVLFRSGINMRFKDPSMTFLQIMFSYFWGIVPLYYLSNVRLVVVMAMLPSFCFGMLRLDLKGHIKVATTFILIYSCVLLADFQRVDSEFNVALELFQYAIVVMIIGWFTLFGSFMSNLRYQLRRQRSKFEAISEEMQVEVDRRATIQLDLEAALNRVKKLTGFIPICANCKNIRDDKGYWNQLEAYISDHSDAYLTHCICPTCSKELYPEFQDPDTSS